jgi:hypothetical protein
MGVVIPRFLGNVIGVDNPDLYFFPGQGFPGLPGGVIFAAYKPGKA